MAATTTETTVITTETTTSTNDQVGTFSGTGATGVGDGVSGGTSLVDAPRAVAVYRCAVPNSRIYVGTRYKQAKNTQGFLFFAPAGEPRRHPHNHESIVYSYGELCVWDECLIKRLDAAFHRGSVAYYRVVDPKPKQD